MGGRVVSLERLGIHKSPLQLVEDEWSNRAFVRRHMRDLMAYVRTRYPRESTDGHLKDLLDADPRLARTVIENFLMPEHQKWERVLDHFQMSKSALVLTIGGKGRRKTMTNTDIIRTLWERRLAEAKRNRYGYLQKTDEVYVYNIGDPDDAPDWMVSVPLLNMVRPGSIVRWDELGVDMSNRTTSEGPQRMLGGQLGTMRHNKLHIFGIVQNMSMADTNFLKMADDLLIKPLGLTQTMTERRGIIKTLEFWRELVPRDDWETLILSKDMQPLKFTRPVPYWWEDSMSHSFGKIPTKALAVARAHRLRMVFGWKKVSRKMAMRGWNHDEKTWKAWVMAANAGIDPGAEGERLLAEAKAEADAAAPTPTRRGKTKAVETAEP